MGFAGVLSGPLVRSSYRAGRLYQQAMRPVAATRLDQIDFATFTLGQAPVTSSWEPGGHAGDGCEASSWRSGPTADRAPPVATRGRRWPPTPSEPASALPTAAVRGVDRRRRRVARPVRRRPLALQQAAAPATAAEAAAALLESRAWPASRSPSARQEGRSRPPRKDEAAGRGRRAHRRAGVEQVKAVWKMTREHDPKLIPLVLGPALRRARRTGRGRRPDRAHRSSSRSSAVLLAVLTGTAIFGRRATEAMYAQVEGRPGAAAAVLQGMRGDWRVTPAVGFTRNQDLVHRVIGRPGVVLVGEGHRPPRSASWSSTRSAGSAGSRRTPRSTT